MQKQSKTNRHKMIISNKRKLENDLDKKQKKISNFKSENKFLRKQIDNLRKEKSIYKNISCQVMKEIEEV